MKRIILLLLFSFLILSCSYEWPPPYVSFDEATAHITEKYGEPAVVRDTYFYDDGTIRNRVVYWDIDPPEIEIEEIIMREGTPSEYTYIKTTEYITYYTEIWNQPSSDRNTILKYRQYGWEILSEYRTAYQYLD